MFSCQQCMRRSLYGIIGDITLSKTLVTSSISLSSDVASRRSYTVEASTAARSSTITPTSPRSYGNSIVPDDLKRRPDYRAIKKDGDIEPRSVKALSESEKKQTAIAPEIQYRAVQAKKRSLQDRLDNLQDPLRLAEFIKGVLLKNDKFDEALELVRAASKSIDCIVSWNHIIDWKFLHAAPNTALKLYNEMKKRGLVPDTYTYTILLRGLASHTEGDRNPKYLAAALSIYQSMTGHQSVTKHIIHTNAVLNVCARAQDMDAMFGIAAKMPPKGSNAPNARTYTIILNALRKYAVSPRGTEDENERAQTKSIMDARRIWDDIVKGWRAGELWLDEELVCSMGRLLLIGAKRDLDDIFSLIEQTMNIRRPFPRFGRANVGLVAMQESQPQTLTESPASDAGGENVVVKQIDSFRNPETLPANPTGQSAYALPGCNTLSLIAEALKTLRMKEGMSQYWKIITQEYGVQPDSANLHGYLRILRIFRASTETLQLLKESDPSFFSERTLKISMAACQRDKNNPAAFENAGTVLDLIPNVPDIDRLAALSEYLVLAIHCPVVLNKEDMKPRPEDLLEGYALGRQIKLESLAQGQRIKKALYRLQPEIITIRKILKESANSKTVAIEPEYVRLSAELYQGAISAYDKMISQKMVQDGEFVALRKERSNVAATQVMIAKILEKMRPAEQRAGKMIEGGAQMLPPVISNKKRKAAERQQRIAMSQSIRAGTAGDILADV